MYPSPATRQTTQLIPISSLPSSQSKGFANGIVHTVFTSGKPTQHRPRSHPHSHSRPKRQPPPLPHRPYHLSSPPPDPATMWPSPHSRYAGKIGKESATIPAKYRQVRKVRQHRQSDITAHFNRPLRPIASHGIPPATIPALPPAVIPATSPALRFATRLLSRRRERGVRRPRWGIPHFTARFARVENEKVRICDDTRHTRHTCPMRPCCDTIRRTVTLLSVRWCWGDSSVPTHHVQLDTISHRSERNTLCESPCWLSS